MYVYIYIYVCIYIYICMYTFPSVALPAPGDVADDVTLTTLVA